MVEYEAVAEAAIAQGFRTRVIRSGVMFLSPDTSRRAVTWHRQHASSDPNAVRAFLRQMKRAGLVWPPPEEDSR